LAFVLTLGLGASSKAQTTTAAADTSNQNVVVLDPFVVNTDKDNGYIATDSLAGGRMNSPIRVTPSTMSSITGQFISDLSLTTMNDVLKWSLNAVPTPFEGAFNGGAGGDVFNYWSVSIRGGQSVQGGNPPTKNFFPLYTLTDFYNVERVEFDHGPNSILFGIGQLGGAVTSYTKQARFDKNFYKVNLTYDTWGGYRGTIDLNEHVGNFALRLNALAANEKGFRDGDFDKKYAIDLAGDYKFNHDNTHIRFEIEGWKQDKAIFTGAGGISDSTSLWDGHTVAATYGAVIPNLGANPLNTPGAPGVTSAAGWGANPFHVYVAGVGLMDMTGSVRSMGTSDVAWGAVLRPYSFNYAPTGGTTVMALPSRNFAVSPADANLKPRAFNVTGTIDHRFNDNLDAQVSYYLYEDDQKATNFEGANQNGAAIDLNAQLPNGQPNPEFKQIYSDYILDQQLQDHRVREVRGQASYHFDTTLWNVPVKQLFSLSAGQQYTNYDHRQHMGSLNSLSDVYNSGNWFGTIVWGRVYWDHPQTAFNVPSSLMSYKALPFNWYDNNNVQDIKYWGAFSQTRLWDDRLNISLGARRDNYEVHKYEVRPPRAGTDSAPGKGGGNSYQAGVVGYMTDWLALVANVSTNFQPPAGGLAPTVYGEILGPPKGTGKDIGLRLSTKDGKYYATVVYYKDTGTKAYGGDSPGFQSIWNDYFLAGGTATDIGPAGGITSTGAGGLKQAQMNYADTTSIENKGYEIELTANPTRNIRLQVHYAAPKGERTDDGPNGRRYFAEHLTEWEAVAGGASAASTLLKSDLTNAQQQLANWAVPSLAGGVPKSQFNAFATYTFTEGMLKGGDIGFGAQETGARNLDTLGNATNSFATYHLLLGYTTVFHAMDQKLHTRFQLNVDNLFGNDTLVYLGYNGTTPMAYTLVPPRKATFSVGVEF
jgi:outer membrane receptor protein involved in Fe transport